MLFSHSLQAAQAFHAAIIDTGFTTINGYPNVPVIPADCTVGAINAATGLEVCAGSTFSGDNTFYPQHGGYAVSPFFVKAVNNRVPFIVHSFRVMVLTSRDYHRAFNSIKVWNLTHNAADQILAVNSSVQDFSDDSSRASEQWLKSQGVVITIASGTYGDGNRAGHQVGAPPLGTYYVGWSSSNNGYPDANSGWGSSVSFYVPFAGSTSAAAPQGAAGAMILRSMALSCPALKVSTDDIINDLKRFAGAENVLDIDGGIQKMKNRIAAANCSSGGGGTTTTQAEPGQRFAGDTAPMQSIVNCFSTAGGATSVGAPFDNGGGPWVHSFASGDAVQDFKNSSGTKSICLRKPSAAVAYLVKGSVWDLYLSMGGPTGKLGYPTANVSTVNGVPSQSFEHGYINVTNGVAMSSATPPPAPVVVQPTSKIGLIAGGNGAVDQAILACHNKYFSGWAASNNGGGDLVHSWGTLGVVQDYISNNGAKAICMKIKGASVAYPVQAWMYSTFIRQLDANGLPKLGFPLGVESGTGIGVNQSFQKGKIIWKSTAACMPLPDANVSAGQCNRLVPVYN